MIEWTVSGKIKHIRRLTTSNKPDLEYGYDVAGNRIMKIKKPRSGAVLLPKTKWTYTFYTRDAQGNVMSTYERPENSVDLFVTDFQIYGSSRLGAYTAGESLASLTTTNQYSLKTGKKNYELTNHLGNIMVTFTDVRKPKDTNADGAIDSYEATVVTANDYYPFGMLQPGRNFNSPDYRFGFQSQEKGDEIASTGNHIDFRFRGYDPRTVRFWSVDPLAEKYPFASPYAYCLNNPLIYTDPDGHFFWTIITSVVDFVSTALFKGGLDPTSSSARNNAWSNFDPTASWSNTNKAWKIDMGLFKTDPNKNFWGRSWELISRFTWQAPQTALGYTVSGTHNLFGGVKSVDYYGGATVVQSYSKEWGAFTVGNYVIGDRSIAASPYNSLFQHEYGHYLQSQDLGPIYLFKVALPSLIDASIHDQSVHEKAWFEEDANARALDYWKSNVPGFNENTDWKNPKGHYASGIHAQHWYDYVPGYFPLNTILFNIQW